VILLPSACIVCIKKTELFKMDLIFIQYKVWRTGKVNPITGHKGPEVE